MTTKKKNYSNQFKIDAVKLVTEQGYKAAEAARNLEIHPNVLRHWVNRFKTDSNHAFPGKGHMTPEIEECIGFEKKISGFKWRMKS